jgi:hydroxylaminobenzene mutase
MDRSDRARGLFFHGMALVLLGLLFGAVVQSVANPRMGLSAHTGTLMNGILVIAMGAFWTQLTLAPRLETLAYWLVVDGSYLNAVSLFLAAAFGTSRSTPLHGAGHLGSPAQELVVAAGLTIGAVAILAGCALALWGLRRPQR